RSRHDVGSTTAPVQVGQPFVGMVVSAGAPSVPGGSMSNARDGVGSAPLCDRGAVCGRFSLYEPASDLAERFGIDEVVTDELPSRWNVAPTQPVYAVATTRDGATRRLRTVRWGLVPSWAKDPTIGNRFINARLETIETARPYRSAFERRRCLT